MRFLRQNALTKGVFWSILFGLSMVPEEVRPHTLSETVEASVLNTCCDGVR